MNPLEKSNKPSHAGLIVTVGALTALLLTQSFLAVKVALIADRGGHALLSELLVNAALAITFFFMGGLLGLVTDLWLCGSFFKRVFTCPTPLEGWHWGLWLTVPYVLWILQYASHEPTRIASLLISILVIAFFSALGSYTGVFVGVRRPSPKEKLTVIFAILLGFFFIVSFTALLLYWYTVASKAGV